MHKLDCVPARPYILFLKQQKAWWGSGTKGNILLCNSCKWQTMLSGS